MVITTSAGGGNDASGRLIARYLREYLPGEPSILVQNMPGANETLATNYVIDIAKPDGLTQLVGSSPPDGSWAIPAPTL